MPQYVGCVSTITSTTILERDQKYVKGKTETKTKQSLSCFHTLFIVRRITELISRSFFRLQTTAMRLSIALYSHKHRQHKNLQMVGNFSSLYHKVTCCDKTHMNTQYCNIHCIYNTRLSSAYKQKTACEEQETKGLTGELVFPYLVPNQKLALSTLQSRLSRGSDC